MSSVHKSVEINGTVYPDGGIPGLTFEKGKEFVPLNGDNEQILKPIETNTTQNLINQVDGGSWAYPGIPE